MGTRVMARAGREAAKNVASRGQDQRGADHCPRQLEHADHMMGARFKARPVRQPGDQAHYGPEQRAHHTHHDTVGPYDETDVPVRGAQGAEHPERAQPALGQHREAAHRH